MSMLLTVRWTTSTVSMGDLLQALLMMGTLYTVSVSAGVNSCFLAEKEEGIHDQAYIFIMTVMLPIGFR